MAGTPIPVDPLLIALIPVASVIVGGILTSLFAMLGQGFADRRTLRREQVARQDTLRIQLYQEDRDNLHSLQELTLKVAHVLAHVYATRKVKGPDAWVGMAATTDQAEECNELMAELNMRLYRARATSVRDALQEFKRGVYAVVEATTIGDLHDCQNRGIEIFRAAQEAMGVELRRPPLDGMESIASTGRQRR